MSKSLPMKIRKASITHDYESVWSIFSAVVQTGDTYVYPPETTMTEMKTYWFADAMTTFVIEEDGNILGTYIIKPNQPGLGNHIANCGYMVAPRAHGRGIGKKLCEHSIVFARESGYKGIQFNIVVSTNEVALRLWQKSGFRITGITPKGFRHKELGFVDTYVMFREL